MEAHALAVLAVVRLELGGGFRIFNNGVDATTELFHRLEIA